MGHRKVLIALVTAGLCSICSSPFVEAADTVEAPNRVVSSPNGENSFHLLDRDAEFLRYKIASGSTDVIESSRIGILLNDVNLGEDAIVESVERYEINEQYPSRANHSAAVNHCRGAKFKILSKKSNTHFVLEVRAFDDGVAFRHIVPGAGPRTPDAATDFTIPSGSIVWHHGLRGHYEGVHESEPIESIHSAEWIAPPLTFKLPHNAGYAAITEAALVNYAGMALQADGDRIVRERLGHSQPIGHPFELRFGKEEGKRLSHPAAIDGEIITPWRVVMIGKDLNTLVNCDIVAEPVVAARQ